MTKKCDISLGLLIALRVFAPIVFGAALWLYLPHQEATVVIATSRVQTPAKPRATLNDVRRDWGIEGRLDCRVIPQGGLP